MYKLFLAVVLFCSCAVKKTLTVANAHSHNDYEQLQPFYEAYNAGFGSIEADIFLENNRLYVAHDTNELKQHKLLTDVYLQPLKKAIASNGGKVYNNKARSLQLLIDLKTDSLQTLQKLVELLNNYPELTGNQQLKFVITGNRPAQDAFANYPEFIWFDGELYKDYTKDALKKIVMLSDNLKRYTSWNGTAPMAGEDRKKLRAAINEAHKLGKPVRFWNAPDFEAAWTVLKQLGVDYINTDHIQLLQQYLQQ